MSLPKIDEIYFTNFLVDLLNIPSPTGFAEPAVEFVEKELSQYSQLQLSRTRKGALVAKWEVKSDLPPCCTHCACGYTGRSGKGNQIQWTVEVKSHWRNTMAERGNRRRVGVHVQRREGTRLGIN